MQGGIFFRIIDPFKKYQCVWLDRHMCSILYELAAITHIFLLFPDTIGSRPIQALNFPGILASRSWSRPEMGLPMTGKSSDGVRFRSRFACSGAGPSNTLQTDRSKICLYSITLIYVNNKTYICQKVDCILVMLSSDRPNKWCSKFNKIFFCLAKNLVFKLASITLPDFFIFFPSLNCFVKRPDSCGQVTYRYKDR